VTLTGFEKGLQANGQFNVVIDPSSQSIFGYQLTEGYRQVWRDRNGNDIGHRNLEEPGLESPDITPMDFAGPLVAGMIKNRIAPGLANLGSRFLRRAGASSAKKACFVAGTLVEAADGLRPIEEIEVGDQVWSRNDDTGEEGWKPVVRISVTPDQAVLDLDLVDVDGDQQELLVTAEHPLWAADGWVAVGELAVGGVVWARDGWAEVVAIADTGERETVYNFEVADFHTYFVGEGGVWAHNAGCRGLWKITEEGTERTMRHDRFGKFYKSKSSGLWWSRDRAGHGRSAWKVFDETSDGLRWKADADQFGDFITGKHKGPTGLEIPWSDLNGAEF
jgi:hypothetical protein